MSTLEGDFWVCAQCRSINNARAKQCYNCRTPRDLAAVDPATIEGTGHGQLREIALPPFHSPRPYAAIASILILAVAGLQVVLTVGTTTLLLQVLDGTRATDEQLAYIGLVGLATLAVGVVALVCWSLWLSRAVTSMPALGLGYPAASGLMAFVENFLPGLNLLRVPAIVRDVVRRLEPSSTAGQSRGEALIFAAWVGLLGGFVAPRVGGFLSGFSSDSLPDVIRSNLTIQGIATGLVLVGALFLVALIWWIEERIDRRREAQLAEIDAKAAGDTTDPSEVADEPVPMLTPTPTPVPASTPIATSTAVPPAEPVAAWSWGGSTASPLAAQVAAPAAPPARPATAPPETPAVPLAAGWERAPIPGSEAGADGDGARHAWSDWRPGGSADAPVASAAPEAAPGADVAAPVEAAPVEAAPAAEVESQPVTEVEAQPVGELEPAPVAQAEAPATVEPPAPAPTTEPSPEPAAEPATPAPTPAANDGRPHLTIRVGRMGMLHAEMAGETEPIILEDLTAYGNALANAGGTAAIVVSPGDDMARLIAKRAQRILAETGIEAPLPD